VGLFVWARRAKTRYAWIISVCVNERCTTEQKKACCKQWLCRPAVNQRGEVRVLIGEPIQTVSFLQRLTKHARYGVLLRANVSIGNYPSSPEFSCPYPSGYPQFHPSMRRDHGANLACRSRSVMTRIGLTLQLEMLDEKRKRAEAAYSARCKSHWITFPSARRQHP